MSSNESKKIIPTPFQVIREELGQTDSEAAHVLRITPNEFRRLEEGLQGFRWAQYLFEYAEKSGIGLPKLKKIVASVELPKLRRK